MAEAEGPLATQRGPALAFALYLTLSALSAAVLFVRKLGPGAASVKAFYLGSEAAFTAPKSLSSLLLSAAPHAVAVPLAIFAVAHVVGFARALGPRAFAALVRVSFGSAALGLGAGFGVRFVWPGLAWVKLGAFLALEASLLAWAALLVVLFWPARWRLGSAEGSAHGPAVDLDPASPVALDSRRTSS